MSRFQILSLATFFKRGCLPWKGDIKNHYCHVLRCKTGSDVYHSGKQIHPMLRNHSNFLGIEDTNPGKATRFFSCGKNTNKPTQRTPTKKIKPSLPHTLWAQLHHLWTLLLPILWNCREKRTTESSSRTRYKLKLLMLHKLLWDWGISGSCNCLLFSECCLAKDYFNSAGCLLELKNQRITKKTEKLTGFPSDQERWHINPIKIFPLQNLEQR